MNLCRIDTWSACASRLRWVGVLFVIWLSGICVVAFAAVNAAEPIFTPTAGNPVIDRAWLDRVRAQPGHVPLG